ncbi:MAG: Maf family protein [Gammaproteobacteria bacterium]|jgi:septum formation protein|nr:Maf family protein [Gammaproteobacteria bacterium]
MSTSQLILASASTRRQQLLTQLGVGFKIAAQHIDETKRPEETPADYVCRMAVEKAQSALHTLATEDASVVLAADTIVLCEGEVLGKPANKAAALGMLSMLSAKSHRALSAVAVANHQRESLLYSDTLVEFRRIDTTEAARYWDTGEPAGKAGSYAIQGFGAAFVKSISGSYSGVMGLPLYETAQLLAGFGVPSWQAELECALE